MSVSIRPARLEDAPALSAIYVSSFPHLFRFNWGLELPVATLLLAELFSSSALSLCHVHIAEEAGRVVGLVELYAGTRPQALQRSAGKVFVRHVSPGRARISLLRERAMRWVFRMRMPGADVAYVMTLAVDEVARGKGVGTALLERAIESAREDGCRAVGLHVLRRNEVAIRVYERLGFVEKAEPKWPPRLGATVAGSIGRANKPHHPVYMERLLR